MLLWINLLFWLQPTLRFLRQTYTSCDTWYIHYLIWYLQTTTKTRPDRGHRGWRRCRSPGVLELPPNGPVLHLSLPRVGFALTAFLTSLLDCETKTTFLSFISPVLPFTVFCNIQEHLIYHVQVQSKLSVRAKLSTQNIKCCCVRHCAENSVSTFPTHGAGGHTLLCLSPRSSSSSSARQRGSSHKLNMFREAHDTHLLVPPTQRLWSAVCLLDVDLTAPVKCITHFIS